MKRYNIRKLSFFDDLFAYRNGLLAQGFWALQIHRFGAARNVTRIKFIRLPWAAIHLILSKISEMLFGIYLGRDAKIGRRLIIEHFGCIIVHNNAIIGDDVVLRQGVTIGIRHIKRPHDAPIIGSRVEVGAGAVILGLIQIGDDARIGANAVVLRDVPAGGIAVGVPATIIDT